LKKITDDYVKYQKYSRPNIDTSHRCILKCPQCSRQKTISQDQIRRSSDMSDSDFQKIVDYYSIGITFCGQISDPIYHPNFLQFLKKCDGTGRAIRIATNGTGKSLDWWKQAFSFGKTENAWFFGVDGIDEKSEIYRVGSNFKNVWEMMKLGKSLGNIIVWQFIIFEYNQHELDEATEIAKREGFGLQFISTNRSFNPNHGMLRKNVSFNISSPDEEFVKTLVKGEKWVHLPPEVDAWRSTHQELKNKIGK
jgi:MoaA/NifB/PqqE/SkfB family radical SAM enzyme